MKDVMLLSLIACAGAEEPLEKEVTLLVGGFLVSGAVITYAKYVEHNTITASVEKAFEEVRRNSEAETGAEEAADKGPNYIHLRDARYFTPGQMPIPGNMGIYVRIPLEAVQGFSFGSLCATRD